MGLHSIGGGGGGGGGDVSGGEGHKNWLDRSYMRPSQFCGFLGQLKELSYLFKIPTQSSKDQWVNTCVLRTISRYAHT